MPEKIPTDRPDFTLLSKATNIGVAIVLLTLSGHWLDGKFHTQSLFIILGAVLGIVYTMYEAWRAIK